MVQFLTSPSIKNVIFRTQPLMFLMLDCLAHLSTTEHDAWNSAEQRNSSRTVAVDPMRACVSSGSQTPLTFMTDWCFDIAAVYSCPLLCISVMF